MQLLTNEIKEALRLFPLYSTEDVYISQKVFICKFFNPVGAGTWYVCEGEPVDGSMPDDDWDFFGMVDLGMGQEWGYFRLSELKGLTLPMGNGIERDISFPMSQRLTMWIASIQWDTLNEASNESVVFM